MRDRTELTPIAAPEPVILSRPKASIDVDRLALSECRALILKQREELYFKQCELEASLAETEAATVRADSMKAVAEAIGKSLREISEYARASAAEVRRRGNNQEGGGTI